MDIQPIKCDKFILRVPRKLDAQSLSAHINNKNIYNVTSHIPYPYSESDFFEWFGGVEKDHSMDYPNSVNFVIDVDGSAIGGIGLQRIQKKHKAELGYWLSEDYWGKGIMTRAVNAVVKFGFDELQLVRIFTHIYEENLGSKKVVEKCGFELEGLLRNDTIKNRRVISAYSHSIVPQQALR